MKRLAALLALCLAALSAFGCAAPPPPADSPTSLSGSGAAQPPPRDPDPSPSPAAAEVVPALYAVDPEKGTVKKLLEQPFAGRELETAGPDGRLLLLSQGFGSPAVGRGMVRLALLDLEENTVRDLVCRLDAGEESELFPGRGSYSFLSDATLLYTDPQPNGIPGSPGDLVLYDARTLDPARIPLEPLPDGTEPIPQVEAACYRPQSRSLLVLLPLGPRRLWAEYSLEGRLLSTRAAANAPTYWEGYFPPRLLGDRLYYNDFSQGEGPDALLHRFWEYDLETDTSRLLYSLPPIGTGDGQEEQPGEGVWLRAKEGETLLCQALLPDGLYDLTLDPDRPEAAVLQKADSPTPQDRAARLAGGRCITPLFGGEYLVITGEGSP